MRIAIIGAGNVGQALGRGWTAARHEIVFGVRDPDPSRYPTLAPGQLKLSQEAAAGAAAIVLATPWNTTEAAVQSLGDLAGRIIIDCTNPLAMTATGLGLALGFERSGGERVAEWAKGAAVFKTLNQTGAENMDRAGAFKIKPVMFVAGDDGAKKATVMDLVRDLGFEAVDAGPLTNARLLEPLGMVWIDQALKRGLGRDFAFAVVRRE
jgi:8-hydroxy-5-deazaflavin:NADPH oxidoreductase